MKQFDDIRESGNLLYEYIRGSRVYGTEKEDGSSDEDRGGVFIETLDELLGCIRCPDRISDEKNDKTWYSLGRFIELLGKSDTSILESLFIPSRFVLFEHPIMTEIKKERDRFVTKSCFKPFIGYSIGQINRARSLGKKVVIPDDQPEPRVLDSVFTFYKQGSIPIKDFLSSSGLLQKYCGLVNIPNCTGNFSCFYDWGNHLCHELGIKDYSGFLEFMDRNESPLCKTIQEHLGITEEIWKSDLSIPLGYSGIVKESEERESKTVRLSSVKKGAVPICTVSFDINAYSQRCIKYKQWMLWKKNRNNERYSEVVNGDKFDKKNALHSIRLMNMGIEIAQGKGVNVDRRGIDSDFLRSIRTGRTEYNEMIEYLEEKRAIMEEAMKESKLPEEVDKMWLNDLLIKLRKEFYGLHFS